MKTVPGDRRIVLLRTALLIVAVVLPACGSTQGTLRVDTPFPNPLGTFKSVQVVCGSEEEKAGPYTARMETHVMVKLKERETFQEYRLSKDSGQSELLVKITILDLKKASSVNLGWYTRNTSRVNCDVQVLDAKTNGVIGAFSVVAKPKYSSIEQAIDDAAVQIADYLREHK